MAYRSKGRDVSVRRDSLQKLEGALSFSLATIRQLEAELAKKNALLGVADTEVKKARERITAIHREMQELSQQRERKPGVVGGLFGLTKLSSDAAHQTALLKIEQDSLESHIEYLQSRLKDRIEDDEKALLKAREEAKKFERGIAIKRRKEDAVVELKAKAASNTREVRTVANGVKVKLPRQALCPYCGRELGSGAHADHIYPVAEGGRSIPSNMVYVCSKCNSMKGALTLRSFILKYSLDRDLIEQRLTELHKRF